MKMWGKKWGAQTYHCPPPQAKKWGHMPPLPPPPRFLRQWDIWLFTNSHLCQFIVIVHKIINWYMKNAKLLFVSVI